VAKKTEKTKPEAGAKAPKAKKDAVDKKAAPETTDEHEDKATDKHLDTVLKEMTTVPDRPHVDQWSQVQCPYCGEDFEVHITSEDDGQTMTEDCAVCCRPISLHIHFEDDDLQVNAYRS
jgi:uncharacterized Zn-finger protein